MFKLLGGSCVALLCILAFVYGDRFLNYVQVPAEIEAVETKCRLEQTKHIGRRLRQRKYSDYGDCERAEFERAAAGDNGSITIQRQTLVTVRYTSRADGLIHHSGYTFDSERSDELNLIPGGRLMILANKSRPDVVQRVGGFSGHAKPAG